MPATEIVRAVAGVQMPAHIHRQRLADDAGHEKFANFGYAGTVAVVEGNTQVFSGSGNRVQNRPGFLSVDRHGLFAYHVAAKIHRPDNILMMGAVHRADDNHIRMFTANHFIKIRRRIARDIVIFEFLRETVHVPAHPGGAYVAKSNQFRLILVWPGDCVKEHCRTSPSPNQCIFFHLNTFFLFILF